MKKITIAGIILSSILLASCGQNSGNSGNTDNNSETSSVSCTQAEADIKAQEASKKMAEYIQAHPDKAQEAQKKFQEAGKNIKTLKDTCKAYDDFIKSL